MRLGPLVTALIILLAVSFVPLAVAETTVLHLHNSNSMDEKAPLQTDPAQQVKASCTFLGPAAASTFRFPPGTYAYVIFAIGPEISSNHATVTIQVFRSATSSFEDIPGVKSKTITGGCAGHNCIIKNEGSWYVSSEVRLDTGDRLAVVITLTLNELFVLVDGTRKDDTGTVFTDSIISISGYDPDGSAVEPVGGYVASVNKLDLLAPWLALFGVVGVMVGTAVVVVDKTEKN